MGLREQIEEDVRQGITKDDKFLRHDLLYFFELSVPGDATLLGTPASFAFPLVLNPEEISLEEPFAVQETETQGGGLFVEENGIVKRILRIKGHTGFRPRTFLGDAAIGQNVKREKRSYTRQFPVFPKAKLSGQRHFQFLQDAVFRTYADLKQDPALSEQVELNFHNPRDDEHWRVIPRRFRLSRSAGDKTRHMYGYEIELLVVGTADENNREFSEDKSWLDSVKDALRAVNSAINMVSAGIRELTAVVSEIRGLISNIDTIIGNAIAIVGAAEDFVNGVTDLITAPIDLVSNTTNQVSNALSIVSSVTSIPDAVKSSIRSMNDGFDRLASHPELFQQESDRQLERIKANQEFSTSSQSRLAEAAANPPTTLKGYQDLGTTNLPGDILRARAELGIGRQLQKFQSATVYNVKGGDTLPNLAARFLGDARKWRTIAVINNLSFPYLSEQGQPGTKRIGDELLMPSLSKAPIQRTLVPILGASPDEPAASRFLGTDFAIEDVSPSGRLQKLFDIPIDVEGGSTDVKLVSGVPNLVQACLQRLTTERGTDHLYGRMGRKRTIGSGIPPLDRELSAFRVTEAVAADPRIASIQNVRLTESSADVLDVEFDAEVRGFSDKVKVTVEG
jgi:hypothetical protein